ncbi:MAG: hypothetical protein QOC99_1493 [Acidobacteriota bacterium]|nr:hypothetical protein [Acidobacteriota bacterium]
MSLLSNVTVRSARPLRTGRQGVARLNQRAQLLVSRKSIVKEIPTSLYTGTLDLRPRAGIVARLFAQVCLRLSPLASVHHQMRRARTKHTCYSLARSGHLNGRRAPASTRRPAPLPAPDRRGVRVGTATVKSPSRSLVLPGLACEQARDCFGQRRHVFGLA